MKEKRDCCYYVPLLESLQALLKNRCVRDQVSSSKIMYGGRPYFGNFSCCLTSNKEFCTIPSVPLFLFANFLNGELRVYSIVLTHFVRGYLISHEYHVSLESV